MTSRSRTCRTFSLRSRSLVIACAISLSLLCGGAASASTETLKRSLSNITQAPLDLLLAPMNGLLSVITRMGEQEDPNAVRVVFFVPGVIWNTGVNIGASTIRMITGTIELIPGVLLAPVDADLDPLFSAVDSAGALVELETPCCLYVKFGIDYTAAVN